ncbi:hypothetical protein CHS0354_026342 [Potamilus streckersoni]|uniref:Circadian locomoter output cycles protein kaput n=1 Tax=Potamilus streckersoni TaxID=2493646 RepID=A0AAE0W717_9BIVA|nr:hypothetical protein CHS0354_026342 [Potamilus streckersoni]
MNFGKRKSLPHPVLGKLIESDSTQTDEYEEGGKGLKRVNRNLSEKKRRDQFNMLVNELCSMVSINNKKMDKSTVLKSTIAFLKNYQETTVQAQAHEIKEDWKPSFLNNDEFMYLMLEALDSFLLVSTQQGTILYVSESVTSLLGHLPSDLINKSVYDFVHKDEKEHLYNLLYNYSVTSGNEIPEFQQEKNQLCFDCNFLRGNLNPLAEPVYETVVFKGSFRHWINSENLDLCNDNDSSQFSGISSPIGKERICFCSTVRLRNAKFTREMSVGHETKAAFTSRHSLEWKFLFLDHRASNIIGYLPIEVLGMSGYDYYHPDDLETVAKSHEQLMQTGEGTSCYYRFLTKGQQWIWLKTRYYITYNQWNSKPEFVVCENSVVSYSDVRSQLRKDMGYNESTNQNESGPRFLPPKRSSSLCSVTSCHRYESQLSSQSGPATPEPVQGPARIQSETPPHMCTSSSLQSSPQTIPEQLQMLLQRHIQRQQEQQQHRNQLQAQAVQFPILAVSPQLSKPVVSQTAVHQSAVPEVIMSQTGGISLMPILSTSGSKGIGTSTQETLNSMISAAPQLHMTPIQRQLHEQLKQKARQVQEAIIRQQEELRKITDQLSLNRQGLLPYLIQKENPANMDSENTLETKGMQKPLTSASQHSQSQHQHPHGSIMVPVVAIPATSSQMMISPSKFLSMPILQDQKITISQEDLSAAAFSLQ